MRKLFTFSIVFMILGIGAVIVNGRNYSSTLGGPVVLISEEDGDPISRLRLLQVPNDSLTDNGGGILSLDTSSGDANAVDVAASTNSLAIAISTTGVAVLKNAVDISTVNAAKLNLSGGTMTGDLTVNSSSITVNNAVDAVSVLILQGAASGVTQPRIFGGKNPSSALGHIWGMNLNRNLDVSIVKVEDSAEGLVNLFVYAGGTVGTPTFRVRMSTRTTNAENIANQTDILRCQKVNITGEAQCGIGKTPATALDVNGTATAIEFLGPLTGAASDNVLKTGDTMTGNLDVTGNVSVSKVFFSSGTGDNVMLGNLSIEGTATLGSSLTVNAASLFIGAHTIPDDTVTTSKIKDDSVTSAKLFRQPESLLEVSGGVMVSNGGNVGIGTAAPASKLSLQAGTGTADARVGGMLVVNTSIVGTDANTNEKDLATYTIPANTLAVNGQGIRVHASGVVAANGNDKTIKLYFDGVAVITTGVITDNNKNWVLDALVHRIGAGSQRLDAQGQHDATMLSTVSNTDAADETGTIITKITGQNGSASANDIQITMFTVEFLGF